MNIPRVLWRARILLMLIALPSAALTGTAQADGEEIVVYTAEKIITMDPTNPVATAVAVRGDRVISVGSLEALKPWLDAHAHRVDERFAQKVLMPGLIDPHLHPLLGALQFGMVWITPEAWTLHDAEIEAVTSPHDYRQRLEEAIAASEGDDAPIFFTWGWNKADHGPMTRDYLDRISPDRPVMILQRSTHEAIFNTAAIDFMGLTEADIIEYFRTEVNWETAHFVEAGMFEVALPRLASVLLSPEFVDPGFRRNAEYLTANGITTVGDLSTGQLDWDLEIGAIERNLVAPAVPFRTVLIPAAHVLSLTRGGLDASFDFVDGELSQADGSPQVVRGKRIKLFADGAMFSELGQMLPPGYIDGHEGEWITPAEQFREQARKYWEEGYRVHVHANGDAGVSFTLDVFEELQREFPRLPNSLVLEHFGFSNDALNRRIARLGATVSANPYYLHALGDNYAVRSLGWDRARRIAPVAKLVDLGVTVALHSDFGMAPADPLFLAWSAITRQTVSGRVFAPPRGLTRDEALRAITIDAAYILGLDSEIGSIQSGKFADFAVLEADPETAPVDDLRDFPVWGVVFRGEIHPALGN